MFDYVTVLQEASHYQSFNILHALYKIVSVTKSWKQPRIQFYVYLKRNDKLYDNIILYDKCYIKRNDKVYF